MTTIDALMEERDKIRTDVRPRAPSYCLTTGRTLVCRLEIVACGTDSSREALHAVKAQFHGAGMSADRSADR